MRIIAALLALTLATASHAQDQERIEAATAYVDSPVQQALLDDMLSPEGITAQMGLAGDDLTAEQQARILQIVTEELATIRPEMRETMIDGLVETFTLEEIRALTEFYSSPVGVSAMKKMNPFMQRTMTSLAPAFQQMQEQLVKRLQDEFGN